MRLVDYLNESILSKKTGLYAPVEIGLTEKMGIDKYISIISKYAVDMGTILSTEVSNKNAGFLVDMAKDAKKNKRTVFCYGHDGEFWHLFVFIEQGRMAEIIFNLYDKPDEIIFNELSGSPTKGVDSFLQGVDNCFGRTLDYGIEKLNQLIKEGM